jgi:hypothetical protein
MLGSMRLPSSSAPHQNGALLPSGRARLVGQTLPRGRFPTTIRSAQVSYGPYLSATVFTWLYS